VQAILRTDELTKFNNLMVGDSGEILNVSIRRGMSGGNSGNWSLQEGFSRVMGQ